MSGFTGLLMITEGYFGQCLVIVVTLLFVSLFARLIHYLILGSKKKSSSDLRKRATIPLQTERKMDFFESVMDELHSVGGANICCGFRMKSERPLHKSDVEEALIRVAQRYPSLRTVVVKGRDETLGNTVKFLRLLDYSNVDLNELDVDDNDWVEVWEDEVQHKFDCEKGPLWRTTLFKERYNPLNGAYHNTILFTFYHGTMDGMSVLKFSQAFLNYLDDATKGKRVSDDDKLNYARRPLQQGVMTLLAPWQSLHCRIIQCFFPLPLLACLVKFCMRISFKFDARNPVTMKFAEEAHKVGEEDARIKLIHRQLASEDTEKLIKLSRKNHCTVQGTMLACCHLAVAKLVQGGNIISPVNLSWYCPVNVRAQCGPDVLQDTLGSYTTILMENVRVPRISPSDPKEFWKFAVQCTQAVHGGIRRGRHLNSLYLLPIAHLLNAKEFVSEFLLHSKTSQPKFASPALSLTNLGRIEIDNEGDYKIEKIFGGSGAYRHGPTFVNHIATLNEELTWSTSYFTGTIRDHVAKEYVTYVFEILGGILS